MNLGRRGGLGVLLLGALAVVCGCGGGTQSQARVSSPFTPEHAKHFEDGIDFVNDPTTLDGHWREEWQADLAQRVEHSDLIARVKVEAVRTHWDLDRNMFQLELSIQQRLHGVAPASTIDVTVHDGDAGYPSVKSSEDRMLNASYVLYVKWYENDIEQLVPHWHLSPDGAATETMIVPTIRAVHGAPAADESR